MAFIDLLGPVNFGIDLTDAAYDIFYFQENENSCNLF